MNEEKTIATVCRKDLEIVGYDSSKVTEEQMLRIAERLGETYYSEFYKRLKQVAKQLGIPKKQRI